VIVIAIVVPGVYRGGNSNTGGCNIINICIMLLYGMVQYGHGMVCAVAMRR